MFGLFKKKINSFIEKISKKVEEEIPEKIKITEKELKTEDIEKTLKGLEIVLLESDVALDVAESICNELKMQLHGRVVKRGETEKVIRQALKDAMLNILNQKQIEIKDVIINAKEEKRPATIIFLGFNGSGKTTTLAKIAYFLKQMGFKVVLAAGDTFRAASIEQLEEHGKNLGIRVIKHKYGSDSAAVIYDAVEHAKANKIDVVLADTAGRSHSNVNLMDELKKICRVNKPDLKILVLDSLTGNDVVEQARRFDEAVGVDCIIMAKSDVYEKGGAMLSAVHTIKKPIIFLGTGQDYKNIERFDARKAVDTLLG
ncbi:MAG: signal recognition particle-docking protein FtsY [Candidatus Aenigmatarchaeota archaeon]